MEKLKYTVMFLFIIVAFFVSYYVAIIAVVVAIAYALATSALFIKRIINGTTKT